MLRTVTYELRIGQEVISSGEAHSARVASTVDPLLGVFLDGGTITGTADLQKAIVEWIRQEVSLVEAAERIYLAALRDLEQIREARDVDKETLYRKMLTVRTTIESSAGKGKSAQLVGLDPRLSRVDSHTLRRYAGTALEILGDPGFRAPEGPVVGAGITPPVTADDIRPALERFEATLARLESQQRRVEEALRVKDEALAQLRRVAINGAKILEGIYYLAGEKFHADRLRSKRRKARSTSEEPVVTTEETEEEPANQE